MNCENFKLNWLDYCNNVLKKERICNRPIDCTCKDLHNLSCYTLLYFYNKKCVNKTNSF